jgi:cytochrome P450
LPSYDPDTLKPKTSAIAARLAYPPQWVLGFFRTFWPIPSGCGWAAVTRYADVAEVLTRNDVFHVPFGEEIARLNDGEAPGTPFVLGIDDVARHDAQAKLVMQAFRRSDVDQEVKRICWKAAQDVITSAENRTIDAIPRLITHVPIEVCRQYYGIEIEDPRKFAYAAIDVSGHLFGLPPVTPKESVDIAAEYVRAVVQQAIDRASGAGSSARTAGPRTVVERLVKPAASDPRVSREDIRSFLIGMIVGFVPTNTIAGGHILEMLLRHPSFLEPARAAAKAGDDDLLKHCLFEAMRFKPLNLGPFRICSRDYTIATGTSRAKTIKRGTKVLASTMSAMFDPRQLVRPRAFNPQRPASDYMLFGHGMHWCIGAFIAQAQITQTFKVLLAQGGLRRASGAAGMLRVRGLFPDHLHVRWE